MKRALLAVVAAVALVAGLATPASAEEEELTVIASASPLYDVASSIGGSHAHVVNALQLDMFGPVGEKNKESIGEADLIVQLAPGVQPLFDQAVAERNPNARVVNVLDAFPGATGGGQTLSSKGPLVWQDPNNMMVISETIRASFASMVPDDAEDFSERQLKWIQVMADIERLHTRTLATCERRSFVTTDPSLDWYVERFGIEQIGADPSDPISTAKAERAQTLFSPDLVSLDVAQQRLQDHDLKSAVLDPITAKTDQARRAGGSYSTSMGLNLDALRDAMNCKKIELGEEEDE